MSRTVGFRPKLQVGSKVGQVGSKVGQVCRAMSCGVGEMCMTHGEECGLLVIGETPGDAPDDVADPENVLDNHWLVVVIANPIVLKKKRCFV